MGEMDAVRLHRVEWDTLGLLKKKSPDVRGFPIYFAFDEESGRCELWPPPLNRPFTWGLSLERRG